MQESIRKILREETQREWRLERLYQRVFDIIDRWLASGRSIGLDLYLEISKTGFHKDIIRDAYYEKILMLESIPRDFDLFDTCPLESLPHLRKVGRHLDAHNTSIKSIPQLKEVGETCEMRGSKIQWLPELETVGLHLLLSNTLIENLKKLKKVSGNLNLSNTFIEELPELEYVGGDVKLFYSNIQSLPKLKEVMGDLNISDTKIKRLPALEYVGGTLTVYNSEIENTRSGLRKDLVIKGCFETSVPKFHYEHKKF